MRNLTITREKSMVACTAKMKVYIEDPIQGDLQIGGVSCRKLGELKNGEAKTFQIENHAARVYVIADKLSKEYSNDFYPIPAGDESVYLTGKNQYDLSAGHPFRFNGLTDANALANRKKGGKKGSLVLVIALIIGLVIGFGRVMMEDAFVSPKEFAVDNLTITLTDAFSEEEFEGFDQCFDSKHVAVFMLKDSFTLMEGLEDYTIAQYGDLVIQGNELDTKLQTENGVTYFSYTAEGDSGTPYCYFATPHKGPDAFWMVQFAVEQDQVEEYRDDIFQWAASVNFD